MVNTCALCKSGHKGSEYSGGYHLFPTNPELREKWLRAIPKPNFKPSSSSRLCNLHFHPVDLVAERNDSNKWRGQNQDELKRRHLKTGAVPKLWPGYPEHYSIPVPAERSLNTSFEQRLQNEIQVENARCQVTTLKELDEKLPPDTQRMFDADGSLIIFTIKTAPIPKVMYSVVVRTDMTLEVFSSGVSLPSNVVGEIIPGKTIQQTTDVLKLVQHLDTLSRNVPPQTFIDIAILEFCSF